MASKDFKKKIEPTAPEPGTEGVMIEEVELKRYAGVEEGVIPESKRFGGGGDRLAMLAGCHVAGQPIEEWAYDKNDFEVMRMCFAFTDEGLEQQRKADAARALRTHGTGASVTDASEKWVVERGDQRMTEGFDPAQAVDYRKELADKHVKPGFVPKFLSKKSLSADGRDRRGYEVVIDEKGKPVTDGESVLGQIPEAKAYIRRNLYQAQHNALMKRAEETTGAKRRGRTSRTGVPVMERGQSLAPEMPEGRIGDNI